MIKWVIIVIQLLINVVQIYVMATHNVIRLVLTMQKIVAQNLQTIVDYAELK